MRTRIVRTSTRGGSRHWLLISVAAVLAIGGLIAWRSAGGTGNSPDKVGASTSTLATRDVKAGSVTVKVQPIQFDAGGAVFKVSFDTHSVDLDQDLNSQPRLTVSGIAWPIVGWSGDGPGGHHRAGELRFTAVGTPTGSASLSIEGLPGPVIATWALGS